MAHATSVNDTCLEHWNEKNETKSKSIKLNNWSFFFNLCYTFVHLNVALPCTVLLQKRETFWVNTVISLIKTKYSGVNLLEPQQSNLSNPEAYSEPCHTYKMECFAKIVNSWKFLKAINYSCKALHHRFLIEFWIRLSNLQFTVWENQGC